MTTPAPRPSLDRLSPYVGGKSKLAGTSRVIKLSSNENPFGASPAARGAFIAAAESLALYPDGGATALREAIGTAEGLDPSQIVCGAGSDEILSLLCLAYAGPGDEVLHSAHGFLMYRLSALSVGAEPIAAPERDLHTDVDALLERAGPRTKLVFVANPNNPTGTLLPDAEITRLREGLPAHTLLVIDGAYAEYVDRPDYDGGRALVSRRNDVVMTRTFSKIHGLAALRLGWCYAPTAVVEALGKVRGPFNVSAAAQAAGAASIADRAYIAQMRDKNRAERARVVEALDGLGLSTPPSEGNFVLADFGSATRAAAADEALQAQGILIRRMESYGLPAYLRLSIGRPDENTALLDGLRGFAEAHAA